MSGKLLVINGRLQRAAGRLLRTRPDEELSLPCPCCGKVYYVQLRTCCLQTGEDDIGSPYPNGLGPFFIPQSLLTAGCGSGTTGYLAFYPGEDGVAQFCMTYNLERDPPIPSSALPVGAAIVTEEDTFVCYENPICNNEAICPSCPACCHEVSLGWRCVRDIDPHPSNPASFLCNFGRTYRVTFEVVNTYEQRTWQFCASAETIRCDQFQQTDIVIERSGVMAFTKACPPDFVASCTGSQIETRTDRVENFGSTYPTDCSGPPTGGSVTESTNTTETDCASWNFTQVVHAAGPDDPDDFCADTVIEEARCGPGNTGELYQRIDTEWNYDRACFDGSTFYRRTDTRWWKDAASCPSTACSGTSAFPCLNQECYYEDNTITSTYTVEIIGIIGCAGPWETYDTNVATGYPGSAAGFFDGWYTLGLGNGEDFL